MNPDCGSGSAPQLAGTDGPIRSSTTAACPRPSGAAEPHESVVRGDEAEVVDGRRAVLGAPHSKLRSLHPGGATTAPAIVREVDPPGERVHDDGYGRSRCEAAEVDPDGKDEHVRCEAVAALVRREPDLVVAQSSVRAP